MTDHPDSRTPRDSGAEDQQQSLGHLFRGWLRSVLGGRPDTSLRETIEDLIEAQEDTGELIGANERVLIVNILKLHGRAVADVMVPRADIQGVDIDTPLPDLIQRMSEDAHSRLPVYRGTLDDVVGMVHIKDVLPSVVGDGGLELKDILRDIMIVAPSMPVLDLLKQMRTKRQHMALVIDEYGGIDGLVTIEDLVEEIVGEIEDEHDDAVAPRFLERADGSLIAPARLPIEAFESRVGHVLTQEERQDIDTLGGLVVSLAGRVPARGEILRHPSGIEFEVLDADPRRVKRLRVTHVPVGGSLAESAAG
jgi:CBS domain containing-hemolysin-like protein